MFGRIFNRRDDPAPASSDESTLGGGDTLPATPGTWNSIAARGNAAIDKAAGIYNRNPKLVGGLALVAGALLLTRMKRGRGV